MNRDVSRVATYVTAPRVIDAELDRFFFVTVIPRICIDLSVYITWSKPAGKKRAGEWYFLSPGVLAVMSREEKDERESSSTIR